MCFYKVANTPTVDQHKLICKEQYGFLTKDHDWYYGQFDTKAVIALDMKYKAVGIFLDW